MYLRLLLRNGTASTRCQLKPTIVYGGDCRYYEKEEPYPYNEIYFENDSDPEPSDERYPFCQSLPGGDDILLSDVSEDIWDCYPEDIYF